MSPKHVRSRLSRRSTTIATATVAALSATALGLTGAITSANADEPPATTLAKDVVTEVVIKGANSPDAIAGSYLVVLKEQPATRAATALVAKTLASTYDAKVRRTFSSALNGFSASLTEEQARKLAGDERVAYVQQNQRFRMSQDNPAWGLDRSDQRDLPLDKLYEAPNAADNVNVYVIDTGIFAGHEDFGGRASVGTDTISDGQNGKDCQGHGSHVAGTIAGKTYGLAKGAKVFGVRVLDCQGSGTTESVVAGIEWVTANAKKPAVANMSLGGPADQALDDAVKKSVAAGITYAVAAGNESADACKVSPAKEPTAITTGATDDTDTRANFSNFGKCVDIFAPGVDVESVGISGPTATATHSGTSMASPHVAGAAALYLSAKPDATPADVAAALIGAATPDKVKNPGTGSPNKLMFTGALTSPLS
ncbi:S8 family peptidase [Kribbella deserti]|uniref:S8 family peptidase n=1 Tax=Kribbella deserti TaxID=1926257 RepID=A0ABV6QNH7_9ACTN